MNKGSNDMTSFLLQIYALIIKNCSSLGGQEKKIIFESLLDQKNYQQDFVSLFPTYSLFFQEYVNHDASVVVNYSNALQNVCAKFLEFRIDNAFFSLLTKIFYAVDLAAFVNSSWFGFLINAGLSVISMTSANSDIASARPLFFKELVMFICKFQEKYTFTKFYELAENVKSGSIQVFLSSQQYQDFIKVFQKRPESYVVIPGVANMLFDEFPLFNQTGMIEQWKSSFNSLLYNIQKKKRGNPKIWLIKIRRHG
jgi:hypothetical protein